MGLTLNPRIPKTCYAEVDGVLRVVFEEWLCVDYQSQIVASNDEIEIANEKAKLIVDTSFFRGAEDAWLRKSTLPGQRLNDLLVNSLPRGAVLRFRAEVPKQRDAIPVLYGKPKVTFSKVMFLKTRKTSKHRNYTVV